MPRKPSPTQDAPCGTFPVYLSARLLAELALRAQEAGTLPKPARASLFIRSLLADLAGPVEDWSFPDSLSAIEFLSSLGFSVAQFSAGNERFLQGIAREDLWAERTAEHRDASSNRRRELTQKLLSGTATPEEEAELDVYTQEGSVK